MAQMSAEKRAAPVDWDVGRADAHFIVTASAPHSMGRLIGTWNTQGTVHNNSYKAVLGTFALLGLCK